MALSDDRRLSCCLTSGHGSGNMAEGDTTTYLGGRACWTTSNLDEPGSFKTRTTGFQMTRGWSLDLTPYQYMLVASRKGL
jgi:hypothetical protein